MIYRATLLVVSLLFTSVLPTAAQNANLMRFNQIGFYPNAPKVAVIVNAGAGDFSVVDEATGETVFTGTLSDAQTWSLSDERVRRADFSELSQPGDYRLVVNTFGTSFPFSIEERVHAPVAQAALKGYYYQRMSMPLEEAYAGRWARPAGHPDTEVLVHPSAASEARPAGTVIAAPRGWYDAGDYNKYIVNSGISTYTLLALYEHYPDFARRLETNIPESGDDVPDVLDESLWNLRWMLDMQDPNDGGVYHKLTHANFQGVIMPHQATAPRYVVQKGTSATLNFAAVMAQAARLFADYETAFPGLADSMRTAALAAWQWARANPNVAYRQNAMNQQFDPDVVTGAYGDGNFSDEFDWAAAELYVTTRADSFLTLADPLDQPPNVPAWPSVRSLGWYTLLHHRQELPAAIDTTAMKAQFLSVADDLVGVTEEHPYHIVMGGTASDFVWGSNSTAGNQGMLLLQAYRLTGDTNYRDAALTNLDYLLGRNATGYSFLTGYGHNPTMNPHHRPSEADDVRDPVPGLLAGGPNPGQQDGCTYSSNLPAKSYVDDWCSYASNEITINWNAPLVYLASGLEVAFGGDDATSTEGVDLGAATPLHLQPPYPNPAQDHTTVALELARTDTVVVEVMDLLGRRVAVLADETLPAGQHRLTWQMDDVPAGVYMLRATTGDNAQTQAVMKVGG